MHGILLEINSACKFCILKVFYERWKGHRGYEGGREKKGN
jgi:hypothetical protein